MLKIKLIYNDKDIEFERPGIYSSAKIIEWCTYLLGVDDDVTKVEITKGK